MTMIGDVLRNLVSELRRRNMVRAVVLYVGAVWALAQGIAQLAPALGIPDWSTRWFLIAAAVGFPFWLVFAWRYQLTSSGIQREAGNQTPAEVRQQGKRRLDYWIIGVLSVAVVLLLTNQFVLRRDATSMALQAEQAQSAEALAKLPTQSVAVLPLANASGDKDQQYFSDGLSEDLINALSQFQGLKVIARNSSFQFRDSTEDTRSIGARLGVAHLLEGSVRRAGDTVRITTQLVKVADGSTLWSQRYDRPYKDLFALQDEIANAVAGALKARLLDGGKGPKSLADALRPASGNLAAYDLFMRARALPASAPDARLRRVEMYEEVIRLDPGYTTAHANLAIAGANIASATAPGAARTEARRKAAAAPEQARTLEPDAAVVHFATGTLATLDQDWQRGIEELRRSDQLLPNAAAKANMAMAMNAAGQPQQAVTLFQQAIALDPLRVGSHEQLATTLLGLGQVDEARRAIDRALTLAPTDASTLGTALMIAVAGGDAAAARAHAERLLADADRKGDPFWFEYYRAMALQVLPDRPAADAALKTFIDQHAREGAYQIAQLQAQRKDREAVFKWLDTAVRNRDPGLLGFATDPLLLPYRDDPRYAALLEAAASLAATQ